MDDQKQLFLFAFPVPSNEDHLIDRIKEASSARNQHGAVSTAALANIDADSIAQLAVGPNHVAFLFKCGRVARLKYTLTTATKEESTNDDKGSGGANGGGGSGSSGSGNGPTTGGSSGSSTGNNGSGNGSTTDSSSEYTGSGSNGSGSGSTTGGSSSSCPVLSRGAKIRRVMMAARRTAGALGERAGVIVDRSRPLVPLSAIPEDLIAQAQVVLQGKSREVIVRELQRTNLNVNEAVNNLLSRDDEEGDEMDESSEAYLPEELLSLLDAGLRSDSHGSAVIDGDNLYASGEGFDYVVARDIARRRVDRDKKNDKTKEFPSETYTRLKYDEKLQYWGKETDMFPTGVAKFVKIAAMNSELIALGDNGFFYSWSWKNEGHGSMTAHPFNIKLLTDTPNEEKFVDVVSCAYRACVVTSMNRVASFMDGEACGMKVSNMLLTPLMEIPDGEKYSSIYVCSLYCLVKTQSNTCYWWGIFPFNERRKLWERMRSKSRRSSNLAAPEVIEGCEVRTKSHPIYTTGSIALNFSSGTPMVGALMESAWTLSELCRFRVMTPAQHDETSDDDGSCLNSSAHHQSTDKKGSLNQYGKRSREEQKGNTYRETAWALNEVIFIHKETSQDTAIVKIVDGAYCGIVYRPMVTTTTTTTSTITSDDSGDIVSANQDSCDFGKIRLMRKDDLVVITPNSKIPRCPENFQKTLQKIQWPSGISMKKMHSLAIDNTGLRLLVEKRGRLHLVRVSVFGKVQSDHVLPVNVSAVCNAGLQMPRLENYGDEMIMMISDSNGSIIPMVRDAAGGFREPVYCGLPRMHKFAIGLRPLDCGDNENTAVSANDDTSSTSRNANRTGVMVTLIAPSLTSIRPKIPSLLQTVLYCDLQGVDLVLDALSKESDREIVKAEILSSRADGNRTILHAAVMNSFATTNKEEADTMEISVDTENKPLQRLIAADISAAEETRAAFDSRWQRMLRRHGANAEEEMLIRELMTNNPLRRPGHDVGNMEDVLADFARSLKDAKKSSVFIEDVKEEASMPIIVNANNEPKVRQCNSIEIVKTLCYNTTVAPYLLELLITKDINGHTPFMCAVNYRAYTAAFILWLAAEELQKEAQIAGIQGKRQSADAILNSIIYPIGSKLDDSPLFMLCMNDTCSFTWTGDEHINQDIFECRTCGLVGTLCCCTECAYTCHRNHECRLKRTSPTAYCDCWEKCSCRALVAGNTQRREKLISVLLSNTDLIHRTNSRGEHLLLFLARTVGRQMIEQEHYQRRMMKKSQGATDTTPEHDLEPPKFARTAFAKLLADWRAVKSLVMLGVKGVQNDALVVEEVFHLNQQHGCSHLDKFAFILLAKCSETHIDTLLNTLIAEANKNNEEMKRDPDIDAVISRFVRAVIRMFMLLTLLSPAAITIATATASGISQVMASGNSPPSRRIFGPGLHTVSFTGLLSLVRSTNGRESSAAKEAKKKNVTNFVLKCRRIFQTLLNYSINELCNMADSLIAPVRLGIIKPTSIIAQNITSDPLDVIEKFLNSKIDLSAVNTAGDDLTVVRFGRKRKRSARKEGDHADEEAAQSHITGESDNSSDSDSDESRPTRSQSYVGEVYNALRNEASSGNYDGDELFSMSEEDPEDDSVESVSSPAEQDDEATSQGNDPNIDEEDDDNDDDGNGDDGDEQEFGNEEDEGNYEEGDENENDRYEHEHEGGEHEEGNGDGDDEEMQVEGNEEDDVGESGDGANEGIYDVRTQHVRTNVRRTNQSSVNSRDTNNLLGEQPDTAPRTDSNNTSQQRVRSNETNNANRSGDTSSTRLTGITSGRHNTLPLQWAMRRMTSNVDRATTTRRNSSSENRESNAGALTTSRHLRESSEDVANSITKTNQQLALSFSLIIRVIVDLMPILVDHREFVKSSYALIPKMLELNDAVVVAIRRLIEDRLSVVWQWMETVLDRTEAQLRFGNALMASPAIAAVLRKGKKLSPRKSGDDRDTERHSPRPGSGNHSSTPVPRQDYSAGTVAASSKKDEQNSDSTASLEDFFDYITALMRSHASENGDDVPIIEFNALKALAFVADAYLSLIDMLEKLDARIALGINPSENVANDKEIIDMFQNDETSAIDGSKLSIQAGAPMSDFFQRSNSLLYPGIASSSNCHAFEHKCVDSLALAERPQLLRPDIEKEEMFGLPIKHKTTCEHRKSVREHGAKHPAHQGLVAPWSNYQELLPVNANDEKEIPISGLSRPNVIVHSKNVSNESVVQGKRRRLCSSSTTIPPPRGFVPIQLESLKTALHRSNQSHVHKSLARWKNTLNLMAKAFSDQLLIACGGEVTGSILLSEMASFLVREAQFRKKMEKFKATQSKDIIFEIERDKHQMIAQTIRQLNVHYSRRISNTSSSVNSTQNNNADSSREFGSIRSSVRLVNLSWGGASTKDDSATDAPPLACHKVKVTFKNEPGEGSGVARSFYAAIADAFLTMKRLPTETQVLATFGSLPGDVAPSSGNRGSGRSSYRDRSAILLNSLSMAGRRRSLRNRYTLSISSPSYYSRHQPHLNEPSSLDGESAAPSNIDNLTTPQAQPTWEPERETLGERLLARVRAIKPQLCNKITGMLLDLQPHQLITILASEELLRTQVEEASEMIQAAGLGNTDGDHHSSETASSNRGQQAEAKTGPITRASSTPNLNSGADSNAVSLDDDTAPLFYRPSKTGYYTPIVGKNSPHRLNAFRNVGRMIGICLMQMEIFPLHLCRHVLKFILGRPINWFDLAFYDPVLFESMRTLVFNEGLTRPEQINSLYLTFEVAVPEQEGGGTVELKPGGTNVAVTHENVVEYIYLFVETRMLGNHLKCLEAIKQGVYDVIPLGSLTNMTAEDLRLLLCGTQEISMALMQSYTTFTDESSASPELLHKFKGWFWSICNKLNNQEKQDLIFFWTGSPTLPPSEDGFQPMPTVLVRPADDHHLPTANTCISRLYVPLYPSKKVLKSKLLTAIKNKNFGFV